MAFRMNKAWEWLAREMPELYLALMFGAKDLQLRQWTVTDPQGFDTTVAVYNLDTTKKPDPDMFKITYPDRPDPR